MEISHKEFISILKEKDKYEKMKENVKDLSEKLEEKQENMKVDSVNSKKKRRVCNWCVSSKQKIK